MSQLLVAQRALTVPGWAKDALWRRAQAIPSLDLRFADSKSLVDATTGSNLVTFTRASSGTFVGSDGLIRTAVTNEPRFDHNPTTGESLGLLVEESRTNLALQSEDFSTTWTVTGTTVTTNNVTGPAGATTADKLIESAGGTTHLTAQTLTVANATAYTLSVFAKAAERSRVALYFGGAGGAAQGIIVNLTTGAFAANIVAAPTSYSIVPFPNGWYRISITATSTGTAANHSIYICDNTNAFSYSGDGTSGIYIWGAQLEAGAFPTSYIPTTTATVTRSADVCSITGSAFSSWYRQDEGTMFAELVPRTFANLAGVASADDNSVNNRVALRTTTSSFANLRVGVSGVAQADFTASPTLIAGVLTKIAGGYKTDDFAISANGSTAASDTSGTSPTLANQLTIGTAVGNSAVNAPIRRITYWPTRLPNSTLQAVTQ